MISSPGIGSGLDVSSIIQQLVAIERQPIDSLETKKSGFENQISTYGLLKSALSEFQSSMESLKSLDKFEVYKSNSSDENSLTATTTSSASEGTYAIDITNLAVAEKQGSSAFTDTDTTTIGSAGDTMNITINGQTISVDYGGKTLGEIQAAINSAAGLSDTVDLTASIVSETSSSHRLVLTSGETGTDYTMSLSFEDSGASPIADPFTLATIVAAEDATFTIDGTYSLTRNSNTVDDAITGVTLNLEAETSGITLDINRDVDTIKSNIQGFVDAYNTLTSNLKTMREGPLAGDSTIPSLESQIRSVLNTAPTGLSTPLEYLAQVGVSISREGVMSIDNADLETALTSDFQGVSSLFADNDQGYAYRLEALADDLLDVDGFIESRKEGLQYRVDSIDSQIARMEFRLNSYEEGLRRQYTNLDVMLSSMQQTSNYLASNALGIY